MGKRTKKRGGFSPAAVKAATAALDKSGKGTPAIVLEAFLPERLSVGDLPLAQINIDHLMALQIGAPGILRESDPTKFDIAEIMRALFICTQDQDLTEELLAVRALDDITGKVVFPRFDAAVRQLARGLQPSILLLVAPKLDAAICAAMKPAVPFGVDKSTNPGSPFPAARTQGPGTAGS